MCAAGRLYSRCNATAAARRRTGDKRGLPCATGHPSQPGVVPVVKTTRRPSTRRQVRCDSVGKCPSSGAELPALDTRGEAFGSAWSGRGPGWIATVDRSPARNTRPPSFKAFSGGRRAGVKGRRGASRSGDARRLRSATCRRQQGGSRRGPPCAGVLPRSATR
jgi:hypothetical protein